MWVTGELLWRDERCRAKWTLRRCRVSLIWGPLFSGSFYTLWLHHRAFYYQSLAWAYSWCTGQCRVRFTKATSRYILFLQAHFAEWVLTRALCWASLVRKRWRGFGWMLEAGEHLSDGQIGRMDQEWGTWQLQRVAQRSSGAAPSREAMVRVHNTHCL